MLGGGDGDVELVVLDLCGDADSHGSSFVGDRAPAERAPVHTLVDCRRLLLGFVGPKRRHGGARVTPETRRLMAKWDSSENLPNIFKKHNINILPISS